MQNGQIIERGSYWELKHNKGVFASLLEEQNRYNLERPEIEYDESETTIVVRAAKRR
jgi:hypothetical protein